MKLYSDFRPSFYIFRIIYLDHFDKFFTSLTLLTLRKWLSNYFFLNYNPAESFCSPFPNLLTFIMRGSWLRLRSLWPILL